MLSLFLIYKWTVFAGIFAAPALALLGIQLATRDRAMQTLCVGQGAMVGVLIGIGLLHEFENTFVGVLGPFASALLLSGLTFVIADRVVANKVASKNTTFALIFALLLAASSLISALFPGLESHVAQVYFGDLATLTVKNSQITVGASVVCLAFLLARWKVISNESFELSVFGGPTSKPRYNINGFLFKAVTLCTLCFSVQFVGFLFTIAMLFLPTGIFNFFATKGLRLHTSLCVIISAVSAATGFFLSLVFTQLPTVPTIVAVMFLLCLAGLAAEKLLLFFRTGESKVVLIPIPAMGDSLLKQGLNENL